MAKMIKGLPEHLLHKNRLQEYAQKAGLQLPVYQTSSEGFPHAPKFRASVRVNQTTYTSNQTFPHKKEAEQDVAKIALQTIKQTHHNKPSFSIIYEDPNCCKSILSEFAFRTNRNSPKYKTTQPDKLYPVYASSLDFDGQTYTGEVGRSRQEAEQLAARIAIESLLGSDSGVLLQIINSKNKTCGGHKIIDNSINESNAQSQRPVAVGPSHRPLKALSMGPSANGNRKNKRKLQDENCKQKQM